MSITGYTFKAVDSMLISSDLSTVFLAANDISHIYVSSWSITGTLNWGYIITGGRALSMSLSPDETYLVFTNNALGGLHKMDLTSVTLTFYTISMNIGSLFTDVSPDSSMILVAGDSGNQASFALYDPSLNIIQGAFEISDYSEIAMFISNTEYIALVE